MSRQGNCYDNAVAESFIQLPKPERIRQNTYTDREETRRGVFDYTAMLRNPKHRHVLSN